MNLVTTSFLNPTLLAKVPTEYTNCFSSMKSEFQEKAKNHQDLTCLNCGFIEVNNRSLSVIECGSETIPPGMSALFVSSFCPLDFLIESSEIFLQSSLFLSRNEEFDDGQQIVPMNKISLREGYDRQIVVMSYDQKYESDLLSQFERYLNNYKVTGNEDLYRQRQEWIQEFKEYCVDSQKYAANLKCRHVFAVSFKEKPISDMR